MCVEPWLGKIPWRKKWQPTPVSLPKESHGQRSLVGYSSQGLKELHMTKVTWNTHSQLLQPDSFTHFPNTKAILDSAVLLSPGLEPSSFSSFMTSSNISNSLCFLFSIAFKNVLIYFVILALSHVLTVSSLVLHHHHELLLFCLNSSMLIGLVLSY